MSNQDYKSKNKEDACVSKKDNGQISNTTKDNEKSAVKSSAKNASKNGVADKKSYND